MSVPLLELESVMLYATRRTAALPNVAIIRRFPGVLTPEELAVEAKRYASSPHGLGRRLTLPRVPAARPLWVANTEPPPVSIAPQTLERSVLATWFADELSVREDPLADAGWHLAAAECEGSTFLLLNTSHLFGTCHEIAAALYATQRRSPDAGGAHPHAAHAPLSATPGHAMRAEIGDVVRRVRTGVGGFARLGNQSIARPRRHERHDDATTLGRPLDALLDRDPSRGRPSTRRVGVMATVSVQDWDEAAASHGGNRLALQAAVIANLLRDARRARVGPMHRPLRIMIPVDFADHFGEVPNDETTLGRELSDAGIVVCGGLPFHDNLAEVHDTCRQAISVARANIATSVPGIVDAMRLLPDAITTRVVIRAQGRFDGSVSDLGRLVDGIDTMGSHTASDVFAVSFPLASDISITTGQHNDVLSFAIVADPSRLGVGPTLRVRVEEELANWGIEANTW